MNPFAIKPMWTSASAFVLFLAATHGLSGQEREFAAYNCAITPPDGWQKMTNMPPQPGLLAAFGKADKTALLLIVVDDHNKTSGQMDDRFVSEFERGVESSGVGKRVSGRFIEVAGIKSYERLGNFLVNGKHASIIMQAVPADGRLYSLQAMRFDGQAGESPEIRRALASFRFIRAPAVPNPTYSSDSAAYRTGYLMGRVAGVAVVIAGAITVVIALIRRRGKRTPATPPPLPPSG